MGIKTRGILFSLMAIIAASLMTGAVYACTWVSAAPAHHCHSRSPDLKIRDQDEPWGHGAALTWTASNMVPGKEYKFSGVFAGLKASEKGSLVITCEYQVREESPVCEADTDPYTYRRPDKMARELIITRCLYLNKLWQIDCLSGEAEGMPYKERRQYIRNQQCRWEITDTDRDGRITFADLRQRPLKGLPLLTQKCAGETRFLLNVKFAETAGNDLQGDTLDLDMLYTLRDW